MSRPKVLVGYAGGMGSAWGYARAGFDVTAIDIHKRQDLPPLGEHVRFIKADFLKVLLDIDYLRTFDLLDGGPPCQTMTRLTMLRDAQGKGTSKLNLIPETRVGFVASGKPYVIENVEDAHRRGHLRNDLLLCGSSFPELHTYDETGRRWLKRHRVFEIEGFTVPQPECCTCQARCSKPECGHRRAGVRAMGVFASKGDSIPSGGQTAPTLEAGRELMDISWMSWSALVEAIPPAYTRYIGGHFLRSL